MNFKLTATATAIALTLSASLIAAEVTTFAAGTAATAAAVNANFNAVNTEATEAAAVASGAASVAGMNSAAIAENSASVSSNKVVLALANLVQPTLVDANDSFIGTVIDITSSEYIVQAADGLVFSTTLSIRNAGFNPALGAIEYQHYINTGLIDQRYVYFNSGDCSGDGILKVADTSELVIDTLAHRGGQDGYSVSFISASGANDSGAAFITRASTSISIQQPDPIIINSMLSYGVCQAEDGYSVVGYPFEQLPVDSVASLILFNASSIDQGQFVGFSDEFVQPFSIRHE